jgi:hypothetical protein
LAVLTSVGRGIVSLIACASWSWSCAYTVYNSLSCWAWLASVALILA